MAVQPTSAGRTTAVGRRAGQRRLSPGRTNRCRSPARARVGSPLPGDREAGGLMGERWFTDDELRELSRPTMDRAIEALDRGDVGQARELCEGMKHEWRFLHDLMVEGIAGLISFVQERLGEDAVADAWSYGQGRGWRRDVETIAQRDRKQI